MAITKCRVGQVPCFCRQVHNSAESNDLTEEQFLESIERDTLPEQNYIFRNLRRSLSRPAGDSDFPYPFYFHMLDGYRPETVSLGHDLIELTPEKAGHFEEQIRNIASESNHQGPNSGELNLIEVLARACKDTSDCGALITGAKALVAVRGQPLSDTPSRLEQCLTIHTAPNRIDRSEAPDLLNQSGVYVIEDYLGACDQLECVYEKALKIVRPIRGRSPRKDRSAIVSLETLPYLAAEHLILASSYSGGILAPDVEVFALEKLGVALLPFTVLGQCRAAGAWFFKGKFSSPENAKLREHLDRIGPFANDWLSTTVSQMVVHSSSMMIFRSLGSMQDARELPLVHCRRVQRALCSLWFSRDLTIRSGPMTEVVHVNAGAEAVARRGVRRENILLQCASQSEVAELLGFDEASFEIPFYASNYTDELDLIQPLFDNVNAGVLAEHQRARKRMRESFRKKLDITAHDYANSINNLVIFADSMSDRGSGLQPELRLQVVRRVASHMRGYAWILRAISKSESQTANTDSGFGAGALADIAFSYEDPKAEDLTTWRNYLYWEALYTAFAALERFPSNRESGDSGFRLKYRFECDAPLENGDVLGSWECETIVNAEALAAGMKNRLDRQRPHWPLKPIKGKPTKLDDLGRSSIIMWGALELLRNACEETALLLSEETRRTMTLAVTLRFLRPAENWKLSIIIDNPASKEPPKMIDFQWYAPMRQLMPNVEFTNISTKGRAVYEFEMEIRNADS